MIKNPTLQEMWQMISRRELAVITRNLSKNMLFDYEKLSELSLLDLERLKNSPCQIIVMR